MAYHKNLVDTVNTYSFSASELHSKLGVTGEYEKNCLRLKKRRNTNDVKNGMSSDADEYCIYTDVKEDSGYMTSPGKTTDIFVYNKIYKKNVFTLGTLRTVLEIPDLIESFEKDPNEDKYIIKTNRNLEKI